MLSEHHFLHVGIFPVQIRLPRLLLLVAHVIIRRIYDVSILLRRFLRFPVIGHYSLWAQRVGKSTLFLNIFQATTVADIEMRLTGLFLLSKLSSSRLELFFRGGPVLHDT